MDFDDRLRDAWHTETPAPVLFENLKGRVLNRRRRKRLQRASEIALTILAVVIFGRAVVSAEAGPMHWLLLPFYAVFLPVVWMILARSRAGTAPDASANTSTYARLRMAQLRTSLRDLWLGRWAAGALLGYALVALGGAWWLGDTEWRSAAGRLLLIAMLWALGTFTINRRLRRRRVAEYRTMRRLIAPAARCRPDRV